MRFAFFLPDLRVDDSGFTLEEFFRNLVNAVKIASPDNYPYPLYEHFYGDGGGGNGGHRRSDELHRMSENFLHRYRVLPVEERLVRAFKQIRRDIERAHMRPGSFKGATFSEYLSSAADFPPLKLSMDLICNYFLFQTSDSLGAAEGLTLLDRCFFERSESGFHSELEELKLGFRARVLARPTLRMEISAAKRFRRDRLYCVLYDEKRPVKSTNTFYVHFRYNDDLTDTAVIEAMLSEDEARHYGTDPQGWSDLEDGLKAKYDLRFTDARTEVSTT